MKRSVLAAFAAAAVAGSLFVGPGTHHASSSSTIEEDDPRWDCRIQGNHRCGNLIFFAFADGSLQAYEADAPNRPACFREPSQTREQVELIFYPDRSRHVDGFGFEVPCPI